MKAFRDNFTTYTVQDWLQKAEKDLKGKALQDLSWTWSEDLSFPPALFSSPKNEDFSLLANKKPWTIGESFTVNDPAESNQNILAALEMGLEGAHIQLTSPFTLADWKVLLDKVILTYITLTISFTDGTQETSIQSLATFLDTMDWDPEKLLFRLNHSNAIPTKFEACKLYKASFDITTDATTDQLAQQLHRTEALLRTAKSEQIFFEVKLSNSFYHNIIYIQSLKILWQNILDANQLDPQQEVYILAKSESTKSIDDNTQKINGTVQAVSAIVAGIDYLEIQGHANEDPNFDRRINRNIQHLLKLESYMDQVMNPTEGSYYFDQLTKEMSESSWAKFQELA